MPKASPDFTIMTAPEDEPQHGRISQRDRLIEVAVAEMSFWRDADGTAFAIVPRGDRIERYAVRSKRFKLLLRQL